LWLVIKINNIFSQRYPPVIIVTELISINHLKHQSVNVVNILTLYIYLLIYQRDLCYRNVYHVSKLQVSANPGVKQIRKRFDIWSSIHSNNGNVLNQYILRYALSSYWSNDHQKNKFQTTGDGIYSVNMLTTFEWFFSVILNWKEIWEL
jgi:hypothetical protein